MKLLLDTHALIWAMEESPALSAGAAEAIADNGNVIFVSIVSLWEIAIKLSVNKLRLPSEWLDDLTQHLRENAIGLLAVAPAHCGRVASLPAHHRDPFDRMLAAQALSESLEIVSADAVFARYGVKRLW